MLDEGVFGRSCVAPRLEVDTVSGVKGLKGVARFEDAANT